MKLYKSVKHVWAEPMTLGEFHAIKHNFLKASDGPLEGLEGSAGYHVMYNKDTDDEYHSWCPTHIFESGNVLVSSKNKVEYEEIENILEKLEYKFQVIEGTTTTTCHAFYEGFSIGYGMSACVDPANFNEETGKHYAKERAIEDATNRLWLCEGYALKFHNTSI